MVNKQLIKINEMLLKSDDSFPYVEYIFSIWNDQ